MPFDSSPARTLSPEELMADSEHMLAWLRSKAPDEVVATDIFSICNCLGATFVREHGHANITFGGEVYGPGTLRTEWLLPFWFRLAFQRLQCRRQTVRVTAAQAIAAVEG